MSKYFHYVKVNGRICPEIHHEKQTDGNGKSANKNIVQSHKLNIIDERLPIQELLMLFPYKEITE